MHFKPTLKYREKYILLFLALLVVTLKVLVLNAFGAAYTGSDDLTFWQCANDYSNGVFHEPYFYGQNYNYALESLMAVPLIALGIPIYLAMPITSSFIGVFPFFLFAVFLFRKGYALNASLILLIPLTLPVEYDIITSLSRGFTSGLFIGSFAIFALLNPHQNKSFVILGLSISFGYILNSNSLVLSFPISIYMLFMNYNKPYFYLISCIAALPALGIKYASQLFYDTHPEFIVSTMWPLVFSLVSLKEGFLQLNIMYQYLTPVFWSVDAAVVFAILLLGLITTKRDWKKGLSMVAAALFILLVLGINKIHDSLGVIFLSSTRMFLGIPIVFGLALYWAKDYLTPKKLWYTAIMALAVTFFVVKASTYKSVIKKHIEVKNFGPIAIKSLEDLRKECSEIEQIATAYAVDLVVFIPRWNCNVPSLEFYNYGCSLLTQAKYSSILSIYERRTWTYQEEKNTARKTILLYNLDLNGIEGYQNLIDFEIIQSDPPIVLLKNNTLTLYELSKLLNFEFKRNSYYPED